MKILVVSCVVILAILAFWLRHRRKKPPVLPRPIPDMFSGFPEHPFHALCRRAGFRYVGEVAIGGVHGIHVEMHENERLFARVPASAFKEIRMRHCQECGNCGQHLYDLYVTGPQKGDPRFYGQYTAYHIARVCGACGKIQKQPQWDDASAPLAIESIREDLAREDDAFGFLRRLSDAKTTP